MSASASASMAASANPIVSGRGAAAVPAKPAKPAPFAIRLSWIIIVLYTVFTGVIVGAIVAIFYKNNTSSVNMSSDIGTANSVKLARAFIAQTNDNIYMRLANITTIDQINMRQTQDMATRGMLDYDDFDQLYDYFYDGLLLVPTSSFWSYASEKGEYIGWERYGPGEIGLEIKNGTAINGTLPLKDGIPVPPAKCTKCPGFTQPGKKHFLAFSNGQFTGDFAPTVPYDPRGRDWYKTVKKYNLTLGQVVWTTKPHVFTNNKEAGLSQNMLAFNSQGVLQGILGWTISFGQFDRLLKGFEYTPNGKIFVIKDSWMVATSTPDSPIDRSSGSAKLVNNTQIADPFITHAWNKVLELKQTNQIRDRGFYETTIDGVPNVFEYRTLSDSFGLEMQVVSGGPYSDFVGDIPRVQAELLRSLKQKSVTTIGIAVAIGGLGLLTFAAFTVFAIARPLSILEVGMKNATNYDFEIVRSGMLARKSRILELQAIQVVFESMMKFMAQALDNNKTLMGRRSGKAGASINGPGGGAGQISETRQLGDEAAQPFLSLPRGTVGRDLV